MNNHVARYPHSGKEKYQLVLDLRESPQQHRQLVCIIPRQKENKILQWLMLANIYLDFVQVMNSFILREQCVYNDVDFLIQMYISEERINTKTCHEENEILVQNVE